MSPGRYRKIGVNMHGDAKYMALSSPPANAQTLWVYLLTGPHTNMIPGLFSAGEAGLAEALGWPLEGFRKAFAEIYEKGMAKADWKARIVWLPNAVKYNSPESPNVVRGWAKTYGELPECDLKNESISGLRKFVEGMGEGFRKAFAEAFPKGLPNQEQEQEQEQEEPPNPLEGEPVTTEATDTVTYPAGEPKKPVVGPAGFEAFWAAYPPANDRKADKEGCLDIWKRKKLEPMAAAVLAGLEKLKKSPDWKEKSGKYIPGPKPFMNQRRWAIDTSGTNSASRDKSRPSGPVLT